MIRRLIIGIAFVLLVSALTTVADERETGMAVPAAAQWLALVDKGQYEASYEQAATYFKGEITKAYWQQKMLAGRQPLGEVTSRTLSHLGLWETRNHDPPQASDKPIPAFEAEPTIDDTYSQLPLIDCF